MDHAVASARQPVNILVVDDLPQQHVVMRTVLEELGENVITVASGREALKAVLERAFAVILLDVNMPGMDGLETASLLRTYRRTARTPIIFVTAYIDESEMKRAYSLGAVDYISAPVVPEILRSKVKVFVEMHRMHHELLSRAEEREAIVRAEAGRAAAEQARQRADFLAAASHALTRSLEIDATLQRIAELACSELADTAFVAVRGIGEFSTGLTVKSARRNDGNAPDFAAFQSKALNRAFPAIDRFVHRLLHEEQVEVEPAVGECVSEAIEGAAFVEGVRRVSAFPLLTGNQKGVIVLCSSEAAMPAEQTTLCQEFVSRASIALENALLFSAIRDGDRRKNEFLAMLAHELRNPLAPIANAAAVMRSASEGDAQVLRWASEIVGTQVEHMVRIVEDLLDVSRIARGTVALRLTPVPLSIVIGRAVETSRPHLIRRSQTLICDEEAVDIIVNGDVVRLAQIVANLLNNASKFTPQGGHISLSTRFADGTATITVADDGQGIDAEFLPHVFELFAQADGSLHRSLGGLGIGLTLVRHLTELHGGSVRCKSDGLGKGSEFVVQLPGTVAERTMPALAPVVHLNRKAAIRVLVVDDLVASAESLEALLTIHGYIVRCAMDGATALQAASEMRPDVIVLDIGLPDMTGYELARYLRQDRACRDALIIALSGYGQEDNIRQAMEAGVDHYLVKPADLAVLLDLLSSRDEGQSYDGVAST
ncbi:response regulator [Paraburkholderia phymatum]|uniref:histidine kinase n=1 Tax=Paraburkholderia phymatum (strain DSM 17167 / CIP 108236 / LMG 21445 / STM815) TaxID=391038 RepID=B2JUS6_PARP8|nr:response regulator [Paraburkholderia phymatum]ACC74704.1 histidine kinase [Paraburkholderia phymatum STM815]